MQVTRLTSPIVYYGDVVMEPGLLCSEITVFSDPCCNHGCLFCKVCMNYVLIIWDIISSVHSIAQEKKYYSLQILHNARCILGILHFICYERG